MARVVVAGADLGKKLFGSGLAVHVDELSDEAALPVHELERVLDARPQRPVIALCHASPLARDRAAGCVWAYYHIDAEKDLEA